MQGLGPTEESRDDAAICFLIRSSWAKQELGHLVESDPYRAVMKSYALVRPSVGPARRKLYCSTAGAG